MISQFWKKQSEIGIFSVCVLLFGFQYYLINEFVVPFPNWGDDLGFIDLARRISLGEVSLVDTYYPFHNMVHVCWFIKLFFWIQLKTFGIIDYTLSVQIGQLLFLPIIFVYRSYFKLQNWSIYLQISFFFILFSLKGNVDNLSALGIFQHAITVLCVVIAGYYSIIKKAFFKSFLITNCCLFLNSTEIMGAIIMLMIMVLLINEPKKYLYIGFSLANLIIYYFGIKHSEHLLQLQSPPVHISINLFLGILTFLGGLFSNVKILIVLGMLYLIIVFAAFLNIPGKLKDKCTHKHFFPIFVFLSIFSIGVLIQVGRSDPNNPDIGIFTSIAARFSFYHLCIFCTVYIILIENLRFRIRILPIAALLFGMAFYGFNLYKIWPNLKEDSKRITLDYYNFFNARENLNYEVDKGLVNRLVEANVMIPPNDNSIKKLKRINEFVVQRTEQEGLYTNLIGISTNSTSFVEIELGNQKSVYAPIKRVDPQLVKIRISTNWLKNNKFKIMYLLQ